MNYSCKTEFGRRFDIFDQSAEMEIYRNLQALKSSFGVFDGNFHQLIEWLEHLKDPRESLIMYAFERRDNLEALIDEASRLLHNFLASAKSLVDHTRVIVDRLYSEHDFRNEYQRKIEQDIANNPLQKFVQRLRNYTQHYTLPILALQITCLDELSFSMHYLGWMLRNSTSTFAQHLCHLCDRAYLPSHFKQWASFRGYHLTDEFSC